MTLEELLRKHAEIRTRMEAREAENSEDKKELDSLNEAIVVKFDNEGVSSTKVPGLGSFIKQERTFASILPERKADAIPIFKRHYPDLVQETINGQTLSAFVREAKKTGQELPAEVQELLKESVTKFIQWRR